MRESVLEGETSKWKSGRSTDKAQDGVTKNGWESVLQRGRSMCEAGGKENWVCLRTSRRCSAAGSTEAVEKAGIGA